MSQLRQRLLPIAGLSLVLMGFLRAQRARLTELLQSGYRQATAKLGCNRTLARMNEPVTGAIGKISEGGRALMTLPAKGRALVELMPPPVQVELKKLSTRGAHACREIFAGIIVVGLIVIVGGYGRLGRGPISLPSLVPGIEEAINGQLSDLRVKIDDAVLQRSTDGPGVVFRLRNIRLIDRDGSVVAQAPLAAIGMSGAALLAGRIAPGSVDFIGPRLLFYASDDGLSLSFYRPTNGDPEAMMRGSIPEGIPSGGESVVAKRATLPPPQAAAGRKLDVTRTVTDVFERARRGDSSYLTRFGVKDAEVVLSQGGVQTLWAVPDFSIDLDHKDERSVLVGQANLASDKGDWKLDFRTEQRSVRQSLAITALIENLVPSGLASTFPSVPVLKALDMPITGETSAEFTNAGKFLSGEAKLELKPGKITPPWDPYNAMGIDSGNLNLRYAKKEGIVEIQPSTLRWGESEATFSGEFRRTGDDKEHPTWTFNLKADDATLAVEEFGLAPMKVDEWSAQGTINPSEGRLVLSRFVIRSGNASLELAGSIADAPGSPEVQLTGTVSPMPFDTLKQFWPKFFAGDARKWTLTNVRGGQVLGGKFTVSLAPGEIARIKAGAEPSPESVNVELGFDAMDVSYIGKMPPVRTGAVNLKLAGVSFTVDIPQGKVSLPSGEEIPLSDGRFHIADLRPRPQQAELTFRGSGATSAVLQLLDHEPLGYIKSVGLKPEYFGGTAAGGFSISMPMREDLEFKHVQLRGVGRLEQAIASNVFGKVNVEGGALDVNISERSAEVKGPILIKGVPADLTWQRIFSEPEENQPPVLISAVLDQNQRETLGLKVNHLVQGPIPVELSIKRDSQGAQSLSMQGDLTGTRLIFGNMGWTKPAGRAASVQFDVAQGADGSTDLKNFKISGDGIAIDGSISLDPAQHLKGFYFSDFSFDPQTHVEITATVRDGNVLDVEAHGPSYDGKQFFQSLFSAGQLAEGGEAADPFSVDLTARLGTVIGFYDTTLSDAQLTAKKRNGKLVALAATGKLGGRAPVTVNLDSNKGVRRIRAESADAGAAFRLIGFYPKVSGGQASLEVNLDAEQSGLKSGTLWANNFDVLGDSVVSDVLTDPQSAAALGTGNRKKEVRQTRISFDKLRAPFSVGNGEFSLNDAYVNGPLLGATMRGRVNFKTQTVNLGGTYVPLYGLNSALGNIPILGGILVGRQGEGIVGITFAIQGQLDNPNVLVNPISVVAPGIFRQIFEFRAEGQNAAASNLPPSSPAQAPSDFSSAAGGGGR